jgi:CRISPR system Cascade subunit CasD
MSVLLLRLAGALQSWGDDSRYTTRNTRTAPTKSAVLGMLAAAQGRRRGADIKDLRSLDFGVRVDQPGQIVIDYHIVTGASHAPSSPPQQRLPTADGKLLPAAKSTKETRRYYLSDAVFLAVLEGDNVAIRTLDDALRRPRYPLYLGRRSCPPSRPLRIGMRPDLTLRQSLETVEWQAGSAWKHRSRDQTAVELTVFFDDRTSLETWDDDPIGGEPFARRFGRRPVCRDHISLPIHAARTHDPMDLLNTEEPRCT